MVGYTCTVNVGTGVTVGVFMGNCVTERICAKGVITGMAVACAQEVRKAKRIMNMEMAMRTTGLYFVFMENFLSSLVE
jgi:hypothetical protein